MCAGARPPIVCPCSRVSVRPEAKVQFTAQLLAKGSVSAYIARTTTNSAGFDRDKPSANGLQLGQVDWTGEAKQSWEGCQVQISDSFDAGLAFTFGVRPVNDLKFFSILSKFNDVATLTAPSIKVEAPINFQIGGPALQPNNVTCDTCNLACPSGVGSSSLKLKLGSRWALNCVIKSSQLCEQIQAPV